MFIKIFLRNDKVKDWIKSENIKTSSILMILKKNLGYKNRGQILRNINYCLSATFLNTKLCWRTDADYSDICCTLNYNWIVSPRNNWKADSYHADHILPK